MKKEPFETLDSHFLRFHRSFMTLLLAVQSFFKSLFSICFLVFIYQVLRHALKKSIETKKEQTQTRKPFKLFINSILMEINANGFKVNYLKWNWQMSKRA